MDKQPDEVIDPAVVINLNSYVKIFDMGKTRNNQALRIFLAMLLLVNLIVLSIPATGAKAQSAGEAEISPPDTENYPIFSTNLKVYDFQGLFIHSLQGENIQLLENGNPVRITGIQEIRPGAQLVFAINPGPPFAIQDSQAVSRYDRIINSLADWGKSRIGTNIDDLSLITTGGASSNHLINPSDWVTVLTSSQVDSRTVVPSLDTLFRGISLASDSPVRPGMGKAVLFITQPLEGLSDEPFDNIIAQAQQHDVRINVWMVTSPGTYSAKAAEQISRLAQETQGDYFLYTGEEELPDLEKYFEPLRNLYSIDYQSEITSSGTHQLQAQVETKTEPVSTLPLNFEFEILPPAPSLIAPPIRITRAPQKENNWSDLLSQTEIPLIPSQQAISIAVDFPDGKPRPLVRSTLYVNGSIVDENNVSPYDSFIWNLENVNSQGTFQIQVEIEDAFGIRGQSALIPVEVILELPEPNLLTAIFSDLPTIAILVLLLTGSLVLLFLVLGGKIKPITPGVSSRFRQGKRKKKHSASEVRPDNGIRKEKEMNRQAGSAALSEALAVLITLEDQPNQQKSRRIPINNLDNLIGSDPKKADIVLEDNSIEAIHARIKWVSEKEYWIMDEHTIAGTWLNFEPVPWDGHSLTDGDLIHFGRIGYLFKITNSSMVRIPVIKTGAVFADLTDSDEQVNELGAGIQSTGSDTTLIQ